MCQNNCKDFGVMKGNIVLKNILTESRFPILIIAHQSMTDDCWVVNILKLCS